MTNHSATSHLEAGPCLAENLLSNSATGPVDFPIEAGPCLAENFVSNSATGPVHLPSEAGPCLATDEEGDGVSTFHDIHQPCFQRKFAQRERKRTRKERENTLFATSLREHAEVQQDIFYDATEDIIAEAARGRKALPFAGKVSKKQNWRCRWWLFWSTFCFHWGNTAETHEDEYGQERSETAEPQKGLEPDACPVAPKKIPSPRAGTEEETEESEHEYITGDTSHVAQVNSEAKWLKWSKTRDEVFGAGVKSWDECWAFNLIFASDACQKQVYLWEVLAENKHIQFGMGLQAIPGDWKRRMRQKQRGRAISKKLAMRKCQRGQGQGSHEVELAHEQHSLSRAIGVEDHTSKTTHAQQLQPLRSARGGGVGCDETWALVPVPKAGPRHLYLQTGTSLL